MVNIGGPSQGCATCRARRIKCDERKPTCFRCEKSKRHCAGYRGVKLRHQLRYTKSRALQRQSAHGALPLTPPAVIQPHVEDQAITLFVKQFILQPSTGNSSDYFGFLIPEIQQEQSFILIKSTLCSAAMAVAMALMGNRPGSTSLLPRASRQYAKALRKVNEALRDPVMAIEDHTLASIVLLGHYELVMGTATQPIGWCSHTDGASMLVKIREERRNHSPISYLGRTLHAMVRSQMIVQSIFCSKAPLLGSEWWMHCCRKEGSQDVLQEVIGRMYLRTAEMHGEMNTTLGAAQRRPQDLEQVVDLVARAKTLDQEFTDLEAGLSALWGFSPIEWTDPISVHDLDNAPAFQGKVDKYTDLRIAAAWNMMRAVRITLSGDILRASAWLCCPLEDDFRFLPEYTSALRLCKTLIQDIIATVPTFLSSTFARDDGQVLGRTALALYILWPLFTIKLSDFTSDAQRIWVSGRLRHIADEIGVKEAGVYANITILLPSMTILKDRIAYHSGKDAAESKCMELVRMSWKGNEKEASRIRCSLLGCL